MLGRRERGKALAVYAEQKSLARIDAVLAKVPADKRPRFFLMRGGDGLQSAGIALARLGLVDLAGEAREFHRLFYGVTPSDAQLVPVVEGAS